mmetsp:Transcript_18719/g.40744  ORF Transcript_18719/g.40744 Transcript_18719/m.40744 type:complete len:89 (+) Transcript_18719:415-681(+)
MISLRRENDAVNHMGYTITGNNVFGNNQWPNYISVTNLEFLSMVITFCGSEITDHCIDFPAARQIFSKVSFVGYMMPKDILQLIGRVL